MFCCLGAIIGFYIGSRLGSPWDLGLGIIGFVIGFVIDSKLMHNHQHASSNMEKELQHQHSISIDVSSSKLMTVPLGNDRYIENHSEHLIL